MCMRAQVAEKLSPLPSPSLPPLLCRWAGMGKQMCSLHACMCKLQISRKMAGKGCGGGHSLFSPGAMQVQRRRKRQGRHGSRGEIEGRDRQRNSAVPQQHQSQANAKCESLGSCRGNRECLGFSPRTASQTYVSHYPVSQKRKRKQTK